MHPQRPTEEVGNLEQSHPAPNLQEYRFPLFLRQLFQRLLQIERLFVTNKTNENRSVRTQSELANPKTATEVNSKHFRTPEGTSKQARTTHRSGGLENRRLSLVNAKSNLQAISPGVPGACIQSRDSCCCESYIIPLSSTKLHHFEQNFSARDESAAFLTND